MVVNTLHLGLLELASSFDEDTTGEMGEVSNVPDDNGRWIKLEQISTKELQWLLKYAMGMVSSQNFETKLGIDNFDKESLIKSRSKCKNTKLRHIFFKLISGTSSPKKGRANLE